MKKFDEEEKQAFARMLAMEWSEPPFKRCQALGVERQDLWRIVGFAKLANLHKKNGDMITAESNMRWLDEFLGVAAHHGDAKIDRKVSNIAHPEYSGHIRASGAALWVRAFDQVNQFSHVFMKLVEAIMTIDDGSGVINEAEVNERKQTFELKEIKEFGRRFQHEFVDGKMIDKWWDLRAWEWLDRSGLGQKHPDGVRRWNVVNARDAFAAINILRDVECSFRCGIGAAQARKAMPIDQEILKCRPSLFTRGTLLEDALPGWRLRRDKYTGRHHGSDVIWLDARVGARWVPIKDVTELVNASGPVEAVP